MKITGMRVENLTTRDRPPADGVGAQRSAAPIDIYEEYVKMGDGRLGPKTRPRSLLVGQVGKWPLHSRFPGH